jgi:membrane protein DedA with SNARE-associated domain
MDLLTTLSEFIREHQHWAAPVLGAVIFVESLVLIGAFVPATALMVMVGGLLAAGVLDPWSVLAWCIGGAVLGDAVSFLIGRKLGPRALRGPRFRRHRRKIARTRLFTRKHGAASIFIGRFFGPVRAFVPTIAGMFQMRTRTFQLANVSSAVIWVPFMLTPGYLATKGFQEVQALAEGEALTLVGVGLAGLTIAVILAWRALGAYLARRAALSAPAE